MIFDELWRLRWKRDRIQHKYDRWIREAQKNKDYNERESLGAEASQERQLVNDQIYSTETMELRRRAERLGLPTPDFSDKDSWVEGYVPGTFYLNPTARTALRQALRKEQRERWELAIALVKDFAVPIIGVIATIVSLVLAFKIKPAN